jgi:hypothetical protein
MPSETGGGESRSTSRRGGVLERAANGLDRRPWLCVLLLLASFYLVVPVKLNLDREMKPQTQFHKVNTDSQLYYALARNLLAGEGYHDTHRRKEIMPAMGHPVWLAATLALGLTPTRQAALALWLSVFLLAGAAWIHTGRGSFALAATWLFGAYSCEIVWLAGNVETTIVLATTLVIFCLALLYRTGFRVPVALATGVALGACLLVRPMFLYAVHGASALALAGFVRSRLRRARPSPKLRGWLLLLLTAEGCLLATWAWSEHRYADPRLVSGTYGPWALYQANNVHLEPALLYSTRSRHLPPAFRQVIRHFHDMDAWQSWQQREEYFMDEVLGYWASHPLRSMHGWFWRTRHFLGLHLDANKVRRNVREWGPRVHPFAVLAGAALLGFRLRRAWRERRWALVSDPSLGIVVGSMFFFYAAMSGFFAYTGFRYVSASVTTLIAAIVLLGYEQWERELNATRS